MRPTTSTSSPSDADDSSKAWGLVVAGYSTAAAGLIAFLTINGSSGTTAAATIGTAGLVIIGLLVPAVGMLQMRRCASPIERAARYGFGMQAFGLVGLLFGVVLVVGMSSLLGYFFSAAFVTASGASAIAGAVLLRRHYVNVASNASVVYSQAWG